MERLDEIGVITTILGFTPIGPMARWPFGLTWEQQTEICYIAHWFFHKWKAAIFWMD